MESFQEYVDEYKKQMDKAAIQKAYKGLMDYIMGLRTHLKTKYPDYSVSGSIYYGYMDMTYFSFFPESLKQRGLKVSILFIHETCRFEIWLAGYNKKVQATYWKLFRESGWDKYQVISTVEGADSIIEYKQTENPDFNNLEALTTQIEGAALKFIKDIETFLSSH
jgi:hypothetical protein